MAPEQPDRYRDFPIGRVVGGGAGLALLALLAGKGCPEDMELGGSFVGESSQGSDEVAEDHRRLRQFLVGIEDRDDTGIEDLPFVEVPDVIDEKFDAAEALEQCLTREKDIACFHVATNIRKCISLQPGDHMPYIVRDDTPDYRSEAYMMNGSTEIERSSVFISSAASNQLGLWRNGTPYSFSMNDPDEIRTQLGLACAVEKRKMHSLSLVPNEVCHPAQSEEECDDAIANAQIYGDYIREALPMADSFRSFLEDYTVGDFTQTDPMVFSFLDSSLGVDDDGVLAGVAWVEGQEVGCSASFRVDGVPMSAYDLTPEGLLEEIGELSHFSGFIEPPPSYSQPIVAISF